MNVFEKILDNLLLSSPADLVQGAALLSAEQIIELVRTNQLFEKGEDFEGNVIGVYSPFTESQNPEKKAGEPYNFKDTGAFFRSFRLKIDSEGTQIVADGKAGGKEDDILEKYTEKIIGFSEESVGELIGFLHPDIIKNYRQLITAL